MRDYKVYLPHHREQYEQPQIMDTASKVMVFALTVGIVWLMVFAFWQGLDRTAEIAEAEAKARKSERLRIYQANADIIKGHEHYIKQVDALIDREYRSKR